MVLGRGNGSDRNSELKIAKKIHKVKRKPTGRVARLGDGRSEEVSGGRNP